MKKLSVLLSLLTFLLASCDILTELTCEHTYEVTETVEATCSKAGYEINTCSKCGKVKKTALPLLEHNYTNRVIEPTCSKEGYTLNICSVCGHEKKTNVVSTTPHSYEQELVDATCSSEGYTINICRDCGHKVNTDLVDKIPHDFTEEVTEPTCEMEGFTTYTCWVCNYSETNNFVNSLGHNLGEWETVVTPTEVSDGLRERQCLRCEYKEKESIVSKTYVDLTYIKEVFDYNRTYECANFDELSHLFNLAVVNLAPSLTCYVYEVGQLEILLDNLIDNCDISYSYGISVSIEDGLLNVEFVYYDNPTIKTNNIAYTQYDSLNYVYTTNKRSETYDEFKINDSFYTFNVKTTEQLHYALERGVKPIIEENTNAYVVYEKTKEILRNIISDDMSDLEKVKAIHDWIVMNVVYDNDLLELINLSPTTLKQYNGFYLEGVFLDNKAVCEGISKAVTVMCNIEGIPCVTVSGVQTNNPRGVGHAWNKVYVNGNWYILDVTSDGTIINSQYEVLTYQYFLISEQEFMRKYIGTNYQNIVCDSKIDIYETMTFTYNNIVYDYVIESQEELNVIVKYLYSNNLTNCTIEFKLKFNYGSSILDELETAYRTNQITKGYSYIDNGSIFMIVKK